MPATPSIIPAITPTTPYSPVHDLRPDPSKSHSNYCLSPSSEPTHFLLMNLLKNGIVHQPQDHPACQDTPHNSSAIIPLATFCARHCIISLTLDLQKKTCRPNPPQTYPQSIQALSLKSKNTAMAWYTLSPKTLSPTTGS